MKPALLQNVLYTMVLIEAKQILFTFILPSKGFCVSLATPCNKYGNEMAMEQICLVSFTSFFFISEFLDVICQIAMNGYHHARVVPVDDGFEHRYIVKNAELKEETLESHKLTVSGDFSPIFDLSFPVTITFHYAG